MKFDSFLIMFRLTRSTADSCIYYHVDDDYNNFVIIGIWVDLNSQNNIAYRALVGALLYIMGTTRPDIAFVVVAVSRYCKNPGPTH